MKGRYRSRSHPTRVAEVIAHEVQLVEGAMRMVSVGGCPAMTVGGLRHGERALAHVADEADDLGVSVEAVTYPGEVGIGIRVRRGRGISHE